MYDRSPGHRVSPAPRSFADGRSMTGAARSAPRPGHAGPLGWWQALTAPDEARAGSDFATRERMRRGRLASVLLLGLVVILLGALWQYLVVDDDHPAMKLVLGVALVVAVLAGILNRSGRVAPAGLLLVVLAELPLAAVPATALNGQLDVLALESFYLLAGAILVAASLLTPWSAFVVALTNSVLILASIFALPHTSALAEILASNNAQQALIGPILMQLIVAIVAFLWARSTLSALRRADRAEEIAALERREVERTYELEEGVQQLLEAHVQLANGNFNARVPAMRNQMLWQIGNSLNNLIGRLSRLAQADFVLRRTGEEAHLLADAVRAQRSGLQPLWPVPSGTPLDEAITALSGQALPAVAAPGSGRAFPVLTPAADLGALPPASPAGGNARTDIPPWLFPNPLGSTHEPPENR